MLRLSESECWNEGDLFRLTNPFSGIALANTRGGEHADLILEAESHPSLKISPSLSLPLFLSSDMGGAATSTRSLLACHHTIIA